MGEGHVDAPRLTSCAAKGLAHEDWRVGPAACCSNGGLRRTRQTLQILLHLLLDAQGQGQQTTATEGLQLIAPVDEETAAG
eukprot:8403596-Alexandrium_andersonii.AAC.1